MNKSLIDALLEERRGYVMRGKKDRVAAVDSQLRELGFENKMLDQSVEAAAVEPEREIASLTKPRRRKV